MTAGQITLLCAIVYGLLGNIVGYFVYTGTISLDGFLFYVFLPYTFSWGLSAMVGVDLLTFVFIGIAFVVSLGIFSPIGLCFSSRKIKK